MLQENQNSACYRLYKTLNSCSISDSYPLPNITDILDQLGNARYFSCLDCYSGYHSIKIRESDRPKTAFSTDIGHYEFNTMSSGLKNAPRTYQRMMHNIISGIRDSRAFCYMDDVITWGSDPKTHNDALRQVLQCMREANHRLQPDKCGFLRKEVTFLGHLLTQVVIIPNPEKIECITNYPVPNNFKELQSFLGLSNYFRRFIDDYASIAHLLTS